MKRVWILTLLFAFILGMVPMTTFANETEIGNYQGKVISILGDSISTFAGYIPVEDGFNLTHRARYPQDNLLTDVNDTWWMQVLTRLDAKLGINDSWAGSRVSNSISGNKGDRGEDACMASLTRIQNLGSNGTPDVILFYGGTNDLGNAVALGTFNPKTVPTEADLTTTKWSTVASAYVATILRMQYYYPSTKIIAMLPTYTTTYYTDEELEEYNAVFAAICQHYGVPYVDLRECGITTADLPDGIHPDATGMDYITDAVLDVLKKLEMTPGKNTVYSITHHLTDAQSSRSYYKGVTHGKPFTTEIIGEELSVTVTMNDEDITNAVYANGIVSIEQVTGDVVITAAPHVKTIYEDYLSPLPAVLCSGQNLWTSLSPENLYYTGTEWGNISANTVYSITIPVSAGDQLWATAFQASGTNGGGRNGIRVTWFDENGVLNSMAPDAVYAEFAANGYLTAPVDAVAVNIPLWKNNATSAVYILNYDHIYDHVYDADCNLCGLAREVALPLSFGGNSVSEDVSGLAFKFDVAVQGMAAKGSTAVYDNAALDGYRVLSMGAIVTNGVSTIDIPCVYLWSLDDDACSFAVRVKNIPTDQYDTAVAATPYLVLEMDGVAVTVYGETQTCSYNDAMN